MRASESRLRVVPPETSGDPPIATSGGEDLALATAVLVLAAVPLGSTAAGLGSWTATSLGLATLGVIFAGHELLASVAASWRRALR